VNLRCLFLLAAVAVLPSVALAGGTCSGVKGGCGRSAYSSSARSSSSGGAVHVDGYTRKDGTYVRPYDRRAPGTATFDAPSEPPLVVKVRTLPRTSARTTAWTGNVVEAEEPTIPVARTRPPAIVPNVPPPAVDPNLRTWTDKSRTFSVVARFGGMAGTKVTLHKTDGTTIRIELDQLSQADRDWIESRRR
jgi:SLA1 Homology Domain 1 (SHD1) protein